MFINLLSKISYAFLGMPHFTITARENIIYLPPKSRRILFIFPNHMFLVFSDIEMIKIST